MQSVSLRQGIAFPSVSKSLAKPSLVIGLKPINKPNPAPKTFHVGRLKTTFSF